MALHSARPEEQDSIHVNGRLVRLGEGDDYSARSRTARLYDLKHDAEIVSWRNDCFRAAGFDHPDSMALAIRRDIERPEVERLLERGASHLQVALILL